MYFLYKSRPIGCTIYLVSIAFKEQYSYKAELRRDRLGFHYTYLSKTRRQEHLI